MPIPHALLSLALSLAQAQVAARAAALEERSPPAGRLERVWGGMNHDVHVHDAQRVWIVGDGGRIRFTDVGGCGPGAWVEQITPPDARSNLMGLHVLDDGRTAWAVGFNGTILHTTQADAARPPAEWHHLPSSPLGDGEVWDVFFLDELRGWVVGDALFLHTEDGGDTWQPVQLVDAAQNPLCTADFRFQAIDGHRTDPSATGAEWVLLAGGGPCALFRHVVAAGAPPGGSQEWELTYFLPGESVLACPPVAAPASADPCPPFTPFRGAIWDIDFRPDPAGPEDAGAFATIANVNQDGYVLASEDGGRSWSFEFYECTLPTDDPVTPPDESDPDWPCYPHRDALDQEVDAACLHCPGSPDNLNSRCRPCADGSFVPHPGDGVLDACTGDVVRRVLCPIKKLTNAFGVVAFADGSALVSTYQSQFLRRDLACGGAGALWRDGRGGYDPRDPGGDPAAWKCWQIWPRVPAKGIDGVDVGGQRTVWAVGHFDMVEHSTDGGRTWLTRGGNQAWKGLIAPWVADHESGGVRRVWVAGQGPRIVAMDFATPLEVNPWHEQVSGNVGAGGGNPLRDLAFVSGTTIGVAVGQAGYDVENLLYTLDGSTWRDDAQVPAGLEDAVLSAVALRVDDPSAPELWALGRDATGNLAVRSQGPDVWHALPLPPELAAPEVQLADLAFWTPEHALVVGTHTDGAGVETAVAWCVVDASAPAPLWMTVPVPPQVSALLALDARVVGGALRAWAVGRVAAPARAALLRYEPAAGPGRWVEVAHPPAFDGGYAHTTTYWERVPPALTAVDVVPTRAGRFQVFVGSNCGRVFHFDGRGDDDASDAWRPIDAPTSIGISAMSYVYDARRDAILGFTAGDDHHVPVVLGYEAYLGGR